MSIILLIIVEVWKLLGMLFFQDSGVYFLENIYRNS